MSKGTVIGLVIAVIVIIAGVVGFAIYRNNSVESNNQIANHNTENNKETTNAIVEKEEEKNENNVENNIESITNNSKVLVVYYSAQTHTKRVAERIAKNLNADIFEIEPVDIYSEADLSWTDSSSRVSKEHNDESLRNIKLKNTNVPNWSEYNTVLIGYPIWWGIAAWPTDTFVKANDFTGKTVIPFCTSYSSGIGQSDKLLKNKSNGGDWKNGQRFYQDVDLPEVDKWVSSIGI